MLGAAPALAADDALSASANAAYLSQSAKKPGTIIRPSGLQYRVLRSGVGKRPTGNDVAQIRYAMRRIDGVVVDSTTPSLPAAVAISTINMAGLSEALGLMREGDRWELVMPANLAFGPKGALNGQVPPQQTLVMDVTLVSTATPRPGEAPPPSVFSLWGDRYTQGAAITIRP
ncbi:MAG TPA: FKBP-type peptidyl-prolyl cis-trans isomerase [Rhizomicrobium sp.]|nr:FKBP-type peptidyl-prolyl cis-trans isomerase [Rhizomicrobium sp.]